MSDQDPIIENGFDKSPKETAASEALTQTLAKNESTWERLDPRFWRKPKLDTITHVVFGLSGVFMMASAGAAMLGSGASPDDMHQTLHHLKDQILNIEFPSIIEALPEHLRDKKVLGTGVAGALITAKNVAQLAFLKKKPSNKDQKPANGANKESSDDAREPANDTKEIPDSVKPPAKRAALGSARKDKQWLSNLGATLTYIPEALGGLIADNPFNLKTACGFLSMTGFGIRSRRYYKALKKHSDGQIDKAGKFLAKGPGYILMGRGGVQMFEGALNIAVSPVEAAFSIATGASQMAAPGLMLLSDDPTHWEFVPGEQEKKEVIGTESKNTSKPELDPEFEIIEGVVVAEEPAKVVVQETDPEEIEVTFEKVEDVPEEDLVLAEVEAYVEEVDQEKIERLTKIKAEQERRKIKPVFKRNEDGMVIYVGENVSDKTPPAGNTYPKSITEHPSGKFKRIFNFFVSPKPDNADTLPPPKQKGAAPKEQEPS